MPSHLQLDHGVRADTAKVVTGLVQDGSEVMLIESRSLLSSKDPEHRQKFAHPGDPDCREPAGSNDNRSEKIQCRYGSACNR